MSKLMLIDAVHQEETRVALVNKGRVEDFDFETTGSEQLRGNIYLAKVTRVEPSLQACFVEYGGNRHGFLAFSEIHPDYYQLPQADREALLEEAAREAELEADEDPEDEDEQDDEDSEALASADDSDDSETDDASSELAVIETEDTASDSDDEVSASDDQEGEDGASDDTAQKPKAKTERRRRGARKSRGTSITRRYKIQEVIRRRQVLLVQVVKEERGNKGAALTTYLSLAGRYSVLMPNTPRGGGISRKIPNGNDRKRLKSLMDNLSVPKGMGLIVRTAGAKRTKSEIRRDYDYLQKLWAKIRGRTMESVAPQLIHEEGGLVHRAMRDMFDREIEEVVVQGDQAYREAKDLAKTLMPTQASKVKRWTAPSPLYVKEGVEDQLDSIFSPVVTMKSGGYLVINQTEALVAIDVNSGKSTRERNIEQTALHTNLEAAEEACRQMRLRDLAGLVVIDFIDMDENKNNRAVEKKMKDALKLDRARVQNNRISQFGLMEISRQRRRAGVLQATSDKCEACDGTGRRRSIPSSALQLLRAVEARAAGGGLRGMTVTAPTDVALYLLNSKREAISAIEEDAGFTIAIKSSATMIPGDFEIEADKGSSGRRRRQKFNRADFLEGDADDHLLPSAEEDEDEDEIVADTNAAPDPEDDTDESGAKRKRRRRGRRGGRRRRKETEGLDPGAPPSDGGALLDGLALSASNLLGEEPDALPVATEGGLEASAVAVPEARSIPAAPREETPSASEQASDDEPKDGKKRRRRRRRKRRDDETSETSADASASAETPDTEDASNASSVPETEELVPASVEDMPAADTPIADVTPAPVEAPTPEPEVEPVELVEAEIAPLATEPVLETTAKPKKKKRGWWSR